MRVVDEQGETKELPNPGLADLRPPDERVQTTPLITYTEYGVTNAILDEGNAYRTPLPCELRTYQLTGYTPTGTGGRFRIGDFVEPDLTGSDSSRLAHIVDSEIAYEEEPTSGKQRRLVEHERILYRPDDLGASKGDPLALLPLGEVEPLALPGESYKLALSAGAGVPAQWPSATAGPRQCAWRFRRRPGRLSREPGAQEGRAAP